MADRIARVWNGSSWEVITSTAAAPTAVVNYQSTAPSSPITGQIWVNTDTNQFNVWSGSTWVAAITTYTYQSTAPSSPITGQIWVDSDDRQFYVWSGTAWISAITTFTYQTTAPSSPVTGQVWIDSDDGDKLYVWSGSSWKSIAIQSGANGAISLNSNTISENYTFPVGYNGMSSGPLTINDGVTVTIPNGSEWSIV